MRTHIAGSVKDSDTGLGVGEVMNYAKWFIVSMIVTLMIVSFMPWTALLFL